MRCMTISASPLRGLMGLCALQDAVSLSVEESADIVWHSPPSKRTSLSRNWCSTFLHTTRARCAKIAMGIKKDDDMLYTRTGPNAPWQRRPRSTRAYLAIGRKLPILVKIPGWHLQYHRNDPMHILFLGIVLHLLGSTRMFLVTTQHHWPGNSIQDRLMQAWLAMRAWCRHRGLQCSQSRFTRGSLGQNRKATHAELKAKAHNSRVMLSWIADVCYHCKARYGETGQLLAVATWSLDDICYVVDSHPDWQLSDAMAERIYRRGHDFLKTYKALAVWAVESRRKLFAWRPKFHYFEHLLDTTRLEKINIHAFWNFAEEDVIGSTMDISHRTHRLTVMERTLDRLYIRMGLAFAGRDQAHRGRPPWLDQMD